MCRAALVKAAPAAHIDGRFQKWDWFHRNSCSSLFPVRQKHAVQTGKFDQPQNIYRSSVVVPRTPPPAPALFLPCLLLQQPGRSYGSTWTQASTCTHVKFTRSVKHICDRAQWRSYDRAEELTEVGTYVRIGGRIGHAAPGKADLPLQYLRPCKISISIHCMNACNDT